MRYYILNLTQIFNRNLNFNDKIYYSLKRSTKHSTTNGKMARFSASLLLIAHHGGPLHALRSACSGGGSEARSVRSISIFTRVPRVHIFVRRAKSVDRACPHLVASRRRNIFPRVRAVGYL